MTTITFEENIKIDKSRFKNILDFKNYLEDNSYLVELKKLEESEITPEIVRKMEETKTLKNSDFANI